MKKTQFILEADRETAPGRINTSRCVTISNLDAKQPALSKMAMYQRDPRAGAFLGGERISGQDIRDQNGKFLGDVF